MEEKLPPLDKQDSHSDVAKKNKKVPVLLIVGIIVGIIIACLAIWYVMNSQAQNQKKTYDVKLQQLEKDKQELESQIAKAESESKKAESAPATTTLAQTIAKIVAVVPTKNYSDLSSVMADSVNVVIAASEQQGFVTKVQAIADMAYFNSATSPWNFNINAATLATYKNGSYRTYLASAGVFGVSANNYFVAFSLDASNKISQVFMAVNVNLLP